MVQSKMFSEKIFLNQLVVVEKPAPTTSKSPYKNISIKLLIKLMHPTDKSTKRISMPMVLKLI